MQKNMDAYGEYLIHYASEGDFFPFAQYLIHYGQTPYFISFDIEILFEHDFLFLSFQSIFYFLDGKICQYPEILFTLARAFLCIHIDYYKFIIFKSYMLNACMAVIAFNMVENLCFHLIVNATKF